MKYGTQTRVKYTVPFVRRTIDYNIKDPFVRKRIQWMLYIDSGNSIAQCSRHFDIPLRTVWYWYSRYDPIHITRSLKNRSRKPIHYRQHQVSGDIIKLVKDIRRKYMYLGKAKIQEVLRRDHNVVLGQTRIQTILNSDSSLKYYGVIKKAKRKSRINKMHMYSTPREMLKTPGGLVYLDVKHLTLPCGRRMYQFTAIDHCTRMLFCKIYPKITSLCGADFIKHVQKMLEDTKIQYIGSDNGSEFVGYVTNLLLELNIKHVFSSPRSPKQNPFVERVIRTTIDELHCICGTGYSFENQQELIDKYLYDYNYFRPHHSLSLSTPFAYYVKMSKSNTM